MLGIQGNNDYLFAGREDKMIIVLNHQIEVLKVLQGHSNSVNILSLNQNTLYSADLDFNIIEWSLEKIKLNIN